MKRPLLEVKDFPGGSEGKASVYNVGDLGSSPGLGRSPGEGNGNPLGNSSVGSHPPVIKNNPMDISSSAIPVYTACQMATRVQPVGVP